MDVMLYTVFTKYLYKYLPTDKSLKKKQPRIKIRVERSAFSITLWTVTKISQI